MDLLKRDKAFESNIAALVTWKTYLFVVVKFLALFFFCTLCLEVYLYSIHRSGQALTPAFLLGFVYLFIILSALVKMIKKLPMGAIMLASPTVPLGMLLIVLATLPLLEVIDKQFSAYGFKGYSQQEKMKLKKP